MDYFSTRASVRSYTSEPLSDALLTSILERATHAPNTGNMQLYSIVVTTTAEGKAALSPAHFNQPAVTSAPALITVCADVRRFHHWCALRSATSDGLYNFQAFSYAMIDAVILAQQIVTIAEMEGLGTCYMGTTTYNAPMIGRALSLPKGVVPVATITLGWPDGESKVSDRMPLDGVMHREVYHDFTDADIDRIYALKESLPENRDFVEINHKETLAQVYADIRYTKEANEHFSKVWMDYLREQGFC